VVLCAGQNGGLASSGIPVLAHTVIEQAEVVISGRSVMRPALNPWACDLTEPTLCVFLPMGARRL
jgi:hypothetical protein